MNAYGIVGQLTFPLLNKSLETQSTTANLQMSITQSCNWRDRMIEDLVAMGFNIELVLADCLYGDHPFVRLLERLKLP